MFDTLIGQAQAVDLLQAAIQRDRVAPAYLFVGPEGVGRGLAAECFATLLLAKSQGYSGANPAQKLQTVRSRLQQRNHPDLLWVEPTYLHQNKRLTAAEAATAGVQKRSPPQVRVEQIREITRFLSRPPLEAERAIVVIEQAETMAEAAANSLLKTLEEPGQATLILIAPNLDALLPTLISRCQRIPFYRLSDPDLATVLRQTGHGDILRNPEILALAQGSPGGAIAHWQQFQALPPDLLAQITHPPTSARQALEQARQIHQALSPESQLWLTEYLQQCYWRQGVTPALYALEQARQHLLRYVQPRLVWEVTLMGMV
jgi:DNA polymerase-3 subunit delta'